MPEQIAQQARELWLIGVTFEDPTDRHFDKNKKAVDAFLGRMVFCENQSTRTEGDLELYSFSGPAGTNREFVEVLRDSRIAFGLLVADEAEGRKRLTGVKPFFQFTLGIAEPSVWRLPVKAA